MFSPNLNVLALLTDIRSAAGKKDSQTMLKARTQVLLRETKGILATEIERTGDDEFSQKYGDIILESPRLFSTITTDDLFRSLARMGQSVVLKRLHKRGDSVWAWFEEPEVWRNSFWPFPVNGADLFVRRDGSHYHLTRAQVLNWDRVAIFVDDRYIPHLVKLVRDSAYFFRAVVAAKGGVMVICRVDAQDFVTWQNGCRKLKAWLISHHVGVGRISMHTLVPISRESRGPGALIYLA
jgi:hypothetical protein